MLGGLAISALLIAITPLSTASAADMPVKAPAPPPPPAFDWNGFYIGAYAGAAWMDPATTTDPCDPSFSLCTAGVSGNYNGLPPLSYAMSPSFAGGGEVGYNWQPTPFTLLGLENKFGYMHVTGSLLANGFDTTYKTTVGNWYDAYTARVGAVDGHAMLFLEGGGVTAKVTSGVVDTTPPTVLNTTTNKTVTGWAAGGGVEYGIDSHWSFKAEYLFLGISDTFNTCGQQFVGAVNIGLTCSTTKITGVQTVQLGLNYRFH